MKNIYLKSRWEPFKARGKAAFLDNLTDFFPLGFVVHQPPLSCRWFVSEPITGCLFETSLKTPDEALEKTEALFVSKLMARGRIWMHDFMLARATGMSQAMWEMVQEDL